MNPEKIRSLGGPGGLRCPCCGGGSRRGPGQRRAMRKLVRSTRRAARALAIEEGRAEWRASREVA